jgi:Domain of unknown function DUF11
MRRRVVLAALLAVGVVGIVPTAQAGPPVLTVDVSVTPGQVRAGNEVRVDIEVTNIGNGTGVNTELTLPAPLTLPTPGGATITDVDTADGSCSPTPPTTLPVVCDLGSLAADESAHVSARVRAPLAPGTMDFTDIVATVDEASQDNPGNGGKQDSFEAAPVTVVVRDANDPNFTGGCYSTRQAITTDNQGTGATLANPIVTSTTVAPGVGICTPFTIEEVADPSFLVACPPGAACKMPQYIEALFPQPPPGQTTTFRIVLDQSVGKVRALYADGVLVPSCPKNGPMITEGKCVSVKPLGGGDTELLVIVASDIRLRG